MDNLEARIEVLERRVGAAHGSSVSHSLIAVEEKLNEMMTDGLQDFMTQYDKLASILLTDNVDDLLQSTETKRNIVLSSDKFIRDTAALLEQIQELQGYVAPECITQTSQLGEKVKPIVSLHLEQQESQDANAVKLASLLQNYSEFIALVSQKFIHYDHLITTWEKKLGITNPTK